MMRFLDENGRIGGKVNLVDLIVLLLVVLIVAVMGVRLGVTDRSDTGVDVEKTVYQMEVRGLRSYSIDAVREGDQLYDSKDGVCMGTITGIEVKDTVDAITKIFAGEELPKETLSMPMLLDAGNIHDYDWKSIVDARMS